MNLLSLKLKNFKGIKSFEVTAPAGESLNISGDNATGKTTLADAFYWILFDKDSQGKKDFGIKTTDETGAVIHGLEHDVEAVFEISGKVITLRKVYHEDWTHKKGNIEKVFSGHTTDYFIDGVPVKKNEYVSKTGQIAEEEKFKLLTSPTYFNGTLKWEKRRDILMKICADELNITDEDVIAANEKLAPLAKIIKERTLDEHKKIISARHTKLNEEIEKLPTRIDEVKYNLPDISGLDSAALAIAIVREKDLLKQKQENLLQIESGGELAQLKTKLNMVNADLIGVKNNFDVRINNALVDRRTAMNEARVEADAFKYDIQGKENILSSNQKDITSLEVKAEGLRSKWHVVNGMQFEIEQETVCPTCGHNLPEDKLADARAKAEADFNNKKANDLESITAQGKEAKTSRDYLEKANEEIKLQIEDLKAKQEVSSQKVTALQQEIDTYRNDNKLEDSPLYNQKLSEKVDVELAIKELQQGNSKAVNEAVDEVANEQNKLTILEGDLNKIIRNEEGQKRIVELEEQQKKYTAEFAKLSKEKFLIDEFTKAKAAMLEDKINVRFKTTRFKMFNVLVNGSVDDCCEALVNTNGSWVPYSIANNAGRINSGLDVINTLSEYYGFTPPIFVDNRESVTELIETQAQVVSLIVSKPDKQLRVETENKIAEVA